MVIVSEQIFSNSSIKISGKAAGPREPVHGSAEDNVHDGLPGKMTSHSVALEPECYVGPRPSTSDDIFTIKFWRINRKIPFGVQGDQIQLS